MQRQRGHTLLELLVVLTIIGFAMTGVSLSLRDSTQTQLERESQRLVAVLEAARAQSRTSGVALIWQTTPEGYAIRPAHANNTPSPLSTKTETWLAQGTQAVVSATTPNWVVLGPEPILSPTRITLSIATADRGKPSATLSVGTHGLRPFQVVP
jgi:general secretion pathway protein H